MPSTAAGAIVGAAGGGVMGVFIGDINYGVVTGAVIGATVAVIASKDNNKKKILLFILSFLTGALITEPVDRILKEKLDYELGGTLTAILVSALFISALLIIAKSETLTKALTWFPRLIEKNFTTIVGVLSEKWRDKK
ncbi:putative holin [Providencia manganoxydans]|uniref:putative holin n=1 Tax=Providencia manganoxydans TaxID=2923283 RepID=UPI0032DB292C